VFRVCERKKEREGGREREKEREKERELSIREAMSITLRDYLRSEWRRLIFPLFNCWRSNCAEVEASRYVSREIDETLRN